MQIQPISPKPTRKSCIFRQPPCQLPRCGLYLTNPSTLKQPSCSICIPLQNIDYIIDIVENIAHITLTQTYENPLPTNLELEYAFPVNPKVCFDSFRAVFGGVEIVGVVKEKQQAKEEYQRGLREGRQVAYAEVSEKSRDIVNMRIGNVKGNEKVEIRITLLQMLDVSLNTFWQLRLPGTISPRYLNQALPPADFNPSTKQIEATEPPAYTWSFKVSVRSQKPITSCNSPTHDLLQLQLSQNKTSTTLVMQQACKPTRDFTFQYSVQGFQQPVCVIGRTDTSTSALVSFIPRFCDLTVDDALKSQLEHREFEFDMEVARAEYLFLLDRSGSMSGGRMEKAKQALIFFLRSLPQQSYFDVYSFGNTHRAMFGKSQKYDNASLKKAVEEIEHMQANMGGTNIDSALQAIFDSPVIEGYPKQIFLLTDGAVSNTEGVIQLVSRNTKFCRVHTIGIGNGASPALIEGCAEKGKGRYIFIQDDANVSGKIIELLSAALSPVISDFKVDLKAEAFESVTPNPSSMPYILKDQPVNLFFIFKHGFQDPTIIQFQYTLNGHKYSKQVLLDNTSATSVPWIDRMAHHRAIQLLCSKLGDEKAVGQHMLLAKVNSLSEYIVSQSVRHQIMCPLTAYVCVGRALGDAELQKFVSEDSLRMVVPQERMVMVSKPGKHGAAKMVPMSSLSSSQKAMYAPTLPQQQAKLVQLRQKHQTKELERAPVRQVMRRSQAMEEKGMRNWMDAEDDDSEDEEESERAGEIKKSLKHEDKKKKKKEKQPEKLEKPSQKDKVSTAAPLQRLLELQQTDGSWDSSESTKKLIAKAACIDESVLSEFGVRLNSLVLVLTIVMAAWLEKHHNKPEYQLIIRKAKGWVNKFVKEAQIDLPIMAEVQALVK